MPTPAAPEDALLGSPAEAEDYRIWKQSRDQATTWLPRTVARAARGFVDPVGAAQDEAETRHLASMNPDPGSFTPDIVRKAEPSATPPAEAPPVRYQASQPRPAAESTWAAELTPSDVTQIDRPGATFPAPLPPDVVEANAAARGGGFSEYGRGLGEYIRKLPPEKLAELGFQPAEIQALGVAPAITPGEPPIRPAPKPITITPGEPPVRGPTPPSEFTPYEPSVKPPQMGQTATPSERIARMMAENAKESSQVSAASDPGAQRRVLSQVQEATAEGLRPAATTASRMAQAAEFLSGGANALAAGAAPFAAMGYLGAKEASTMNPEGDLRYMSQQLGRGPLGPAQVGAYADYLQQNPDVLNRLYQDRVISSEMYWALTPPAT